MQPRLATCVCPFHVVGELVRCAKTVQGGATDDAQCLDGLTYYFSLTAGHAEGIRNRERNELTEVRQRRSPRLAMEFPIRVSGTDFRGKGFVEDSATLIVNQDGAKIRLIRQLVPEQQIRILCRQSAREATFRVVSRTSETRGLHTFWGVECLESQKNIWGLDFPPLGPKDQSSTRAMLYCPLCRARELLYVDEPLLQSIQELGGLVRGCLRCGKPGLWKKVPYWDS